MSCGTTVSAGWPRPDRRRSRTIADDCGGNGGTGGGTPADDAVESWTFPDLEVTAHGALGGAQADELYHIYVSAFGPLGTLAAARQLLSRAEFDEEMTDARVTKYVARDESGILGVATMTTDLSALAWISPDFYRARFPESADRDTLFYLGFILVRPDLQVSRVFHRLCQVVTQIVADEHGVLCYDICAYNNNDQLRFADRIESFVKRHLGGRFAVVDTQTYYSIRFDDES